MSEINYIIELIQGFFLKIKTTGQYQRKEPSLLDKYKHYTYKTGSSRGRSDMDFTPITCEDKICIASTLQSYVYSL